MLATLGTPKAWPALRFASTADFAGDLGGVVSPTGERLNSVDYKSIRLPSLDIQRRELDIRHPASFRRA